MFTSSRGFFRRAFIFPLNDGCVKETPPLPHPQFNLTEVKAADLIVWGSFIFPQKYIKHSYMWLPRIPHDHMLQIRVLQVPGPHSSWRSCFCIGTKVCFLIIKITLQMVSYSYLVFWKNDLNYPLDITWKNFLVSWLIICYFLSEVHNKFVLITWKVWLVWDPAYRDTTIAKQDRTRIIN